MGTGQGGWGKEPRASPLPRPGCDQRRVDTHFRSQSTCECDLQKTAHTLCTRGCQTGILQVPGAPAPPDRSAQSTLRGHITPGHPARRLESRPLVRSPCSPHPAQGSDGTTAGRLTGTLYFSCKPLTAADGDPTQEQRVQHGRWQSRRRLGPGSRGTHAAPTITQRCSQGREAAGGGSGTVCTRPLWTGQQRVHTQPEQAGSWEEVRGTES